MVTPARTLGCNFGIGQNSQGLGNRVLLLLCLGVNLSPALQAADSVPETLPTVNLVEPSDGATFFANTNITLRAEASQRDGEIKRVDFYIISSNWNASVPPVLLNSVTNSPYQMAWDQVWPSDYFLFAQAVDNLGGTNSSARIKIHVIASTNAPTVKWVSPTNGAEFSGPTNITLMVEAAKESGWIRLVSFSEQYTEQHLGTVEFSAESPNLFRLDWTNMEPGDYLLRARAADNVWKSISADVRIRVAAQNPLPVVTVAAADDAGSESASGRLGTNTITFRFTRTGDTNVPLKVYFFLQNRTEGGGWLRNPLRADGTFDQFLVIPTGSFSAELTWLPINDFVETNEIVTLRLRNKNYGVSYEIGTPASATVLIENQRWEQPPTIRLISPSAAGVYRHGEAIMLEAEAERLDRLWNTVAFYVDGFYQGEVAEAPYRRTTWLPAGTHSIFALVRDRFETTDPISQTFGRSDFISIQVYPADSKPVVSIMPTNSVIAEAAGNAILTVIRSRSSLDQPLTVKLLFPPLWPMAVNGVDCELVPDRVVIPPGSDRAEIAIKAIDDAIYEGDESLKIALLKSDDYHIGPSASAVIVIQDNETNQPGIIRITNPVDGQEFRGTNFMLLTAEGSDPDTVISRVEYWVDGGYLANGWAYDFRYVWQDVPNNQFTLTARAVDAFGIAITSAPVRITVTPTNCIPVIKILSPTNDTFLAPTNLFITAWAADLDGTIESVEFFDGTNRLGVLVNQTQSATNIFEFASGDIQAGKHVLTAKVTDNLGATSTSNPIKVWVGVNPELLPEIKLVPTSYGNAYAINGSGTLFGWRMTPVRIVNPQGVTGWTAVAGSFHTLALNSSGELYFWLNQPWGLYGQMMGTTPGANGIRRVALPGGVTHWKAIATSYDSCFASGNVGELYVWPDYGSANQDMDAVSPKLLARPSTVHDWKNIITGDRHIFAISADDQLYGWGENFAGQLGIPTNVASMVSIPTRVIPPPGVNGWLMVAAGKKHTLALGDDRQLYAWGTNSAGQLGIGKPFPPFVATPVAVTVPLGVSAWKTISTVGNHNLAISADGGLYAWGNNQNSELGDGGMKNLFVPTRVAFPDGVTGWQAIAATTGGSLAVGDDCWLYAWGIPPGWGSRIVKPTRLAGGGPEVFCDASNSPPIVKVFLPGAPVVAGSAILSTIEASDGGGNVDSLEFFLNGESFGAIINESLPRIDLTWVFNKNFYYLRPSNYVVTVKATDNLGATAVSEPVTIALKSYVGSLIAEQPQDQTVAAGADTVFKVEASTNSAVMVTYQWRRNGLNIPEATNSVLIVSRVALDQSGDQYTVLLSTEKSLAVSVPALLTVLRPPPPPPPPTTGAAVALNNYDLNSPVQNADGTLAPVADTWVEVWGGPPNQPLKRVADMTGTTRFNLSEPGYFDASFGIVLDVAMGAEAQFQVRAWRGGTSFETASFRGASIVFTQATGAVLPPPNFPHPAFLQIPAAIVLQAVEPSQLVHSSADVPAENASVPRIIALSHYSSGECQLTIASDAGAKVTLQTSADLVHWESLAVLTVPAGTLQVLDPGSGAHRHCFYRVLPAQ
jgi:hypothetical protein